MNIEQLRAWAMSYAPPIKCGPDGYVNEGGIGFTKGYWKTENGVLLRSFMLHEFGFAAVAKTLADAEDIACHSLRANLAGYFAGGHGSIYWRLEPQLSTYVCAFKTDIGPEGPQSDDVGSQRFWTSEPYYLANAYARCWRAGSSEFPPKGNLGWMKNDLGIVFLPLKSAEAA